MKFVNYGIDGPIVLRNLILLGSAAIAVSILAHFQFLPIQKNLSGVIFKISVVITIFNLLCVTLSIWSSKNGKIIEAERLLDTYAWRGDELLLGVGCGRGLMVIAAAKRLVTGKAVGVDVWDRRDQTGNTPDNAMDNVRFEGFMEKHPDPSNMGDNFFRI